MVKRGGLPRPAVPEQAGNQLQYLQNAPGRTTKKICIAGSTFIHSKNLLITVNFCAEEVVSILLRDTVEEMLKDRQHRTRGGTGFSFITHKPRGAEYHVIYQMKAMIFVYALVLSNKI